MDSVFFLIQQTMFFSIPLLVVALGGMFSERSGVVNIALEGIMVIGAFTSIFAISILQNTMSGQLLLIIAVLIAAAAGMIFSIFSCFCGCQSARRPGDQRNGPQYVCACICGIRRTDGAEYCSHQFQQYFPDRQCTPFGQYPYYWPYVFPEHLYYHLSWVYHTDYLFRRTLQDEIRAALAFLWRASPGGRLGWHQRI